MHFLLFFFFVFSPVAKLPGRVWKLDKLVGSPPNFGIEFGCPGFLSQFASGSLAPVCRFHECQTLHVSPGMNAYRAILIKSGFFFRYQINCRVALDKYSSIIILFSYEAVSGATTDLYSGPSILQPSILRPPFIIRLLDLVPKANFLC